MKAIVWRATFLLVIGGCSAPGAHSVEGSGPMAPSPQRQIEQMKGQRIDVLMKHFGSPDAIEPAADYSAKFENGVASVVLTYKSVKRRVYVTSDSMVLGVVPIKE